MLEQRSEQILKHIIEDYIRTAEPVGSKYLNERYSLGFSPATVRNEMSILESDGYLRALHTSSGRIPTEKAYVYYLKNICQKDANQDYTSIEDAVCADTDAACAIKTIAKKLVEMSGETAIVAFDPRWSYYTGVSNLFQKPDFQDPELVSSLSELVDAFDEVIHKVFDSVTNEPQVWIGTSNPFGNQMTTIIARFDMGGKEQGLLGLVGPIRMNYSRNIALIEQAKEVIKKISYDG